MKNLKHLLFLVSLVLFCIIGSGITSWAEQPIWPVKGIVSSNIGWRFDPFGQGKRFHAGMDIAAPFGTPIVASQRGIVAFSGRYGGYGNLIAVAHENGLYTLYGHAAVLYAKPNQIVEKGQVIALVGSTGRSTGPHLHFEVHNNGKYINPQKYLTNGLQTVPNIQYQNIIKQHYVAETTVWKNTSYY